MTSETSAEVIIVGTGVVGAVIAEQLLDAGHSVLMIEAGPRVSREEIVESFRNVPLGAKGDTSAPYPPRPWAPHPFAADKPEGEYLQLTGPDSYAQTYAVTRVGRRGTGRAHAGA
jgi:fructose 5-dehydrogenase large subunit